jgi:hypothetical protein
MRIKVRRRRQEMNLYMNDDPDTAAKKIAKDLGSGKGDFVRVHQQGGRLFIEKASGYEGEEKNETQ